MVLTIFLCVLFVLLVSCMTLFMFAILLPALKNNANFSFMVFPATQAQYQLGRTRTYPKDLSVRANLPPLKQNDSKIRLKYEGKKNCHIFFRDYSTSTTLKDDCIGFATCAIVCPQDAIVMKNGEFFVTQNCTGCSLCVASCPKGLVKMEKIEDELQSEQREYESFAIWQFCCNLLYSIEKKFGMR